MPSREAAGHLLRERGAQANALAAVLLEGTPRGTPHAGAVGSVLLSGDTEEIKRI